MYNLILSLAAGLLVTLAVRFGTSVGWVGSILPGVLVAGIAYALLARRTKRQLDAVAAAAQKELMTLAGGSTPAQATRRVEKAIQILEEGLALGRWQFLVSSQLHGQIGALRYAFLSDFDGAEPDLAKAYYFDGSARAMLAFIAYRRKDLAGMRKHFDEATKKSKKTGVLWAAWAWVEEKEGRHDEAIAILSRGLQHNGSDEKLKAVLQVLQNDKKLKLGKVYGDQWFQFRMEAPPAQVMAPQGGRGRRVIFR